MDHDETGCQAPPEGPILCVNNCGFFGSATTMITKNGDDAVYEELHKPADSVKPLPLDEDLPGMGQYYCLHCDRYFQNVAVRDDHFKTKKHRKRLKQLMIAPHSQLDADLAAGMGMPDNGPKLMIS